MDKETLKKIVAMKKAKNSNGNNSLAQDNNSATPNNPNNSVPQEKNSTEVSRGIPQKVSKVSLNLGSDTLEKLSDTFRITGEKFKSDTFDKNGGIPPNTSVENSPKDGDKLKSDTKFESQNEEKTEDDEDIIIKDNMIKIKGSNKSTYEIFYGYAGPTEDSKRVINLKVPQLPQFQLIAKKKEGALKVVVTIDFYQDSGRAIYFIRNKKEVVEKLYGFRGQKHISKSLSVTLWRVG